MLALMISIAINLIAHATFAPGDTRFVRTQVADGSVWADVWEADSGGASLRATFRLGDADPRLRFVPVDVDGDGRRDVVVFALDGRGLTVWRATDDGFVRVE